MYIIHNDKKINVVIANTFFKRLKGFMFKKNIDYCIYFPRCNSIHTFFMKENIDVVMTDKDNKILKIEKNVAKNKFVSCKKASNTYEFPSNSVIYNIGDKIKIEDYELHPLE